MKFESRINLALRKFKLPVATALINEIHMTEQRGYTLTFIEHKLLKVLVHKIVTAANLEAEHMITRRKQAENHERP
jgi:hypothetical protein